mgnify:CR=1 FL=1
MSEILFDSDIIKATAAELGMDEKKIEHHLKFMTSHIETLQNTEGLHAIRLPHIGTMYRNIKACSSLVHTLKRYKPNERRLAAIEKNSAFLKDVLEKLKSFEHFSLHNYQRRLNNMYFNLKKNKRELEKFQNNE